MKLGVSIKVFILTAGRQLQTRLKVFSCRKVLAHGDDLHLGARTKIWVPKHVRIGNQVHVDKDEHIEAKCSNTIRIDP